MTNPPPSPPPRLATTPQSGSADMAERPASIAQLSGLKSAMCRIQPGIRAGAMKAEDRKVSGSSRKVLIPMIDSRSRTSIPSALDSAPNTVPSSTEATTRTATPPVPPG